MSLAKIKIKMTKEMFFDLCLIIGFALLTYGVYCWNRPASFIVAGLLLMVFAIVSARNNVS